MRNILALLSALALVACDQGYRLTDLEMRNALGSAKLHAAQVHSCQASTPTEGVTICEVTRDRVRQKIQCPYARGTRNELRLCGPVN